MNLKQAFLKSLKFLKNSIPLIIATVFLIGLINNLIPKEFYTTIFSKNALADSFIGGMLGSILAGSPITSYVLAGELIEQGISMIAITAFLIAWVTVGIVQLPAEAMILGKKFAFLRNLSAFLLSILAALLIVLIINIL